MHALGKEYVYPGVELQEHRAQAFYDAAKWKDARAECEKLLTMLKAPANPARQRAQLRVAECRVQLKGSPSLIAAVKTTDLEVDSERLYALSQAYRSAKKEAEMFLALNTLAQNYPVSKWNEEGLMAAGNYHWVELDRTKAVINYQRVMDTFTSGKYAFNCEWRIAWVAYLNRQPHADDRLAAFLLNYAVSALALGSGAGGCRSRSPRGRHGLCPYHRAEFRFPQDQRCARRGVEGALSASLRSRLAPRSRQKRFRSHVCCRPHSPGIHVSGGRRLARQRDRVDAGSSENRETPCQAAQSPLHEEQTFRAGLQH